jgi:LacI family transcriptional regulator
MDSLLARHVDGVIWAVPEIGDNRRWIEQDTLSLPVPIVFLTMQSRPGISSVSYNNFSGGKLATRHLLQAGYKEIGHISGPSGWWEANQRKAGWILALEQAGKPVTDRMWAEGNWSAASGAVAFKNLRTTYPEMDAVFVANDQMAFSVIQTAWKLGINIPEDLGVVGFDGLAESAFLWPPLSTVYQDLFKLGSLAVEKLVGMIEQAKETNGIETSVSLVLEPELVVRESSQPQKAYSQVTRRSLG